MKNLKIKHIVDSMDVLVLLVCIFFASNPFIILASEKVNINLKNIDTSIQKEIDNQTPLSLSSNPYDYIADNEYYDTIIKLGVAALPQLETTLQESKSNGLNEYIIAIAMNEISKADVKEILNDQYAWANAKAFLEVWSKIKSSATGDVIKIIQDKNLKLEEKKEKIENYGVLAVPAMESFMSNSEIKNKDVLESIQDLSASYQLKSGEVDILEDYITE